MPDDSSINISLGVTTGNLQAALATAKANLAGFTSEAAKLSAQMVNTGNVGDSALRGALKNINTDARQTTQAIANMNREMGTTATHAHGAGSGVGFYTREIHALIDEGLSGRMAQFQGTMANVAFTFFQTRTAALAIVAPLGLVAAALAYVAYQAYTSAQAVKTINMGAAVTGVSLATDSAKEFIKVLKETADVSNSDAGAIVDLFTRMKGASETSVAAMVLDFKNFSKATNTEGVEAAKLMAKTFDVEADSAKSLGEIYRSNLTPNQLAEIEAAQRSGNVNVILATNIRVAAEAGANATKIVREETIAHISLAEALALGVAAEGNAAGALTLATQIREQHAKKLDEDTAARRRNTEETNRRPQTPAQIIDAGTTAGKGVESTRVQIRDLNEQIEKLAKAKAELQKLDSAAPASGPFGALGTNVNQIADINSQLETLKTRLAQVRSVDAGGSPLQLKLSNIQIVADKENLAIHDKAERERAAFQESLKNDRNSGEQQVKIIEEISKRTKIIKDANESYEEAKARRKAQLADKGSTAESDAAIREARLREKSLPAKSPERLDAGTRVLALETAKQDQLDKIAQAHENGRYEREVTDFELRRSLFQDEVNLGRVTNAQKLAGEIAFNAERLTIDSRHAQFAINIAKGDVVATVTAEEAKLTLYKQSALARQKIESDADKKIYQENKKSYDQIADSAASLTGSLIKGQMTWAQAGQSAASQVLDHFLKATYRKVAEKLAGDAAEKTSEVAKVPLTVATEAGKTAAVATGSAARLAVVTEGAVAGAAVEKAAGAATVSGSAAKAAAATYASVSEIPIIGPILAPPAAALAYGAVMAFGGGFAQGHWGLPSDSPIMAHKGEMIVPAAQTPWAQSLMANAAGQGGGGGGGGDTHHWNINGALIDGGKLANIVKGMMEKNPSMRPAY